MDGWMDGTKDPRERITWVASSCSVHVEEKKFNLLLSHSLRNVYSRRMNIENKLDFRGKVYQINFISFI